MFTFDLTKEPLTNLELKAELHLLKQQRKTQIKQSCISDVLHAFIFIGLYFGHFLTGYATLATVAISTVVAVSIATTRDNKDKLADWLAITALASATIVGTSAVLYFSMSQPLIGSIIAGIATGSIVIVGATFGRKVKQVMVAIEAMKPIIDDEWARLELSTICRNFPKLEEYRDTARQNLRPHLTYGELTAMQQWAKNNSLYA